MSTATKIEWTRSDDGTAGTTWNPVTGCTKVSPRCDHCYAETFAERWRGIPGHHFEHGFDVTLRPERVDQPLDRALIIHLLAGQARCDLHWIDITAGWDAAQLTAAARTWRNRRDLAEPFTPDEVAA